MASHSVAHPKKSKPAIRRFSPVLALTCLVCLTAPSPSAQGFPRPNIFYGEGLESAAMIGWDYDLNGDGRIDYRKKDLDGDGVFDLYLYDRDFNGSFETVIERSKIARSAQRRLIICVDSVPFALMEELWREGHLRDFYPPCRLISTFPSDTNPALTEVFETEKTPGVENRYYDRAKNRVVGGKWDHMVRRDRPADRSFHGVFEYEEHPRYGALMYIAPYLVSDHDLQRCRIAFWKCYRDTPAEKPIILYIGSTDAVGHKRGRDGMRRQLLMLEEILDEIVYATAGGLRITLFSDHGNNMAYSDRMIDLGGHLARNGFRLATALTGEKDVVVPRFGLVGDVCLYTDKENKEHLAEILTALRGVDFALYEKNGDIFVAGARGKAKISARGGRYRYQTIDGDPLGLAHALKQLEEYENLDQEGFADDDLWFEATKGDRYPDIVRRAVIAMTDHVVNRPDIILSLEEGFCYGSGAFVKMIDLLGTHGSARDTQTFGMVMCTNDSLPDYIRGSDLIAALGEQKSELAPTALSTATPVPPTPTATRAPLSPTPTASPVAPGVTPTVAPPAAAPKAKPSPAPVAPPAPSASAATASPAPTPSPARSPAPTASPVAPAVTPAVAPPAAAPKAKPSPAPAAPPAPSARAATASPAPTPSPARSPITPTASPATRTPAAAALPKTTP